jgi:hypothetical protein
MRSLLTATLAAMLLPTVAQADLASVWLSGKGATLQGSGDVFERFEPGFTGGAEIGVHFLFLDVWAEMLAMDQSQGLFSANVGPSISFGSTVQLKIGAYGSFMLFIFPKEEKVGATGLQFTPDQELILDQLGHDTTKIKKGFADAEAAQEDISNLGSGFAARGRASLEWYFIPVMAVGLEGLVGYHWLLGGEAAAAGAKNEIIEQLAREQNLPGEATDILREATGAKAINEDELGGLHYQGGLYLKLKLGL